MSGAGNQKAIAAVTATLRKLLDDEIKKEDGSYEVTNEPPDRARENREPENRLNLFLYHTLPDAAWRSADLPPRGPGGSLVLPPLALRLYYMITPFAQAETDNASHRMLGRAMSYLHDHPLLDPADLGSIFPSGGVQDQIERVRITLQPLSLEEMSKVWSMFQSQYRISVCYEVCVVLVESAHHRASALPVLRRGKEDRGVFTAARPSPALRDIRAEWNLRNDTAGGPPNLLVRPEPDRASASLGDLLTLTGQYFGPSIQQVRFQNPRLANEIFLVPAPMSTPNEIVVQLPRAGDPPTPPETQPQMARWTPGVYMVGLVTKGDVIPDQIWVSDEMPFRLAPKITISPLNANVGLITLTVSVSPRLRDEQQPVLLLGHRQLAPDSSKNPPDESQPTVLTFSFTATAEEKGSYTVRLRVDGAESLPYAYKDEQIIFDDQVQVRIT
jgi:hypothetical protein